MAKKRMQLFRAKKYKEKREFEKWRNSPDYKPVTFWDTLRASERLEERLYELGWMICKAESEKLIKAINS